MNIQKRKRNISLLLVALLLCMLYPVRTLANTNEILTDEKTFNGSISIDKDLDEESIWDGKSSEKVFEFFNTYTIDTSPKLAWFANQVNNGNTFEEKTVLITGNLNLNNENWTPIARGQDVKKFDGKLRIENCTIKGLKVSGGYKEGSGLFGNIKIKDFKADNLKIENAQSSNSDWRCTVGNLFGRVEVEKNGSFIISNSFFSGSSSNHHSFGDPTGGIVGSLVLGDTSTVEVTNIETCFKTDAGNCVGSLFAEVIDTSKTANIKISKVNTNDILNSSTSYGYNKSIVGGLIGVIQIGQISIDRASINGTISSSGYFGYAGGLIGYADYDVMQVENVAIKAEINSYWNGVYGYVENAGGFLGYSGTTDYEKSFIRNSYVVGKINSGVAFCAHCQSSTNILKIQNCYFDSEATTIPVNKLMCTGYADLFEIEDSNSKGLGTNELKHIETYNGWDFNYVWSIEENQYPVLKWILDDEKNIFTIGRDNNLYDHTGDNFYKDYKKATYKLFSSKYKDALLYNQSLNYKNRLIKRQEQLWTGDCFGLSAAMIYAYNKKYDIKPYLQDGCEDYPYFSVCNVPVLDTDMLDLLNTFHLSQFRSDMYYTDITYKNGWQNLFNGGSSIKDFLAGLVQHAKKSKYKDPFLLGCTYDNVGHAVVVCGIDSIENGYYKISVCDPNGSPIYYEDTDDKDTKKIKNYEHSKYSYLMVKTDFSECYYENCDGKKIIGKGFDSSCFKELKYFTLEDAYSGNHKVKSVDSFDCEITFGMNDTFFVTTDGGKYLSYDGNEFSGDLKIDDISSSLNGSFDGTACWRIKLSNIKKIDFSNLSTEVDIECLFGDDEYISLSGENIKKAIFEKNKGITIDGINANYKTCISAKDNNNTLIQITGSTSEQVKFLYDNSDIKINGKSSNLIINKITKDGIFDLNKPDPIVKIENGSTDNGDNSGNANNGISGGNTDSGNANNGINGGNTDDVNADNSGNIADNINNGSQNTEDEKKLKIGDKVKIGDTTYTIINLKKREVSYTNTKSNASKLSIASAVKILGKKYRVTKIDDNAFANNKKVTRITIGKNISVIGKNAFKGCTKLKNLTITSNVKLIGASAFCGTKKLTTLTITSNKLTKKNVKNSLKGSYVKTVKLKGDAKKAYKKYCKYFKKVNCGKRVKIIFLYNSKCRE